MKNKLIIIEGIPGSGKTTFCQKYLSDGVNISQNIFCFYEWTDNKILEDYLNDMKNKAYNFQCTVLEHCKKNLIEAINLVNSGKTVLMDRGPWGNSCFAELQYKQNYISETEMQDYRKKLSDLLEIMKNTDVEIEIWYLSCEINTCLERIKKRGTGENYTYEYLYGLEKEHKKFIFNKYL